MFRVGCVVTFEAVCTRRGCRRDHAVCESRAEGSVDVDYQRFVPPGTRFLPRRAGADSHASAAWLDLEHRATLNVEVDVARSALQYDAWRRVGPIEKWLDEAPVPVG